MKKQVISILGSTGSIGTQTLDIVAANRNLFSINYLTTNFRTDLLELQCKTHNPNGVVISGKNAYENFVRTTDFKGKILFGEEGLNEAASACFNDLVVVALVGFAGVEPTLTAIRAGKTIALANKETLVTAGGIIVQTAKDNNVSIYPVDSEHSAILQCMLGESKDSVEKLIITASGGPFLNMPLENLQSIKAADALKHPTWNMGKNVTINSATMMNKGFEVIEAHHLFALPLEKIDVIIHPQSAVHSFVQFIDGSIKAQIALTDMRLPISFAIGLSNRLKNNYRRFDFADICDWNFIKVDEAKYPCFTLAIESMRQGGNAPTILNAANEVAVERFLRDEIRYMDIPKIIEKAMCSIQFLPNPNISEIIETHKETISKL